jgi:hypothetical protein
VQIETQAREAKYPLPIGKRVGSSEKVEKRKREFKFPPQWIILNNKMEN